MFKAILIFIKTHAIASAVTATVVVGAVVATPIVVSNIILDNNVKANLNMLATSVTQTEIDSQAKGNEQTTENNKEETNKEPVNTNEPLTFEVKRIETNDENGTSMEYKIIPSYDKDFSKWTRAEKEAYEAALKEAARMGEEDYNAAIAQEQQAMFNAMREIQEKEASYSDEYSFNILKANGYFSSETWRYNSYSKLYSCGYTEDYADIINESYEVTIEDFRNVVYPSLKQKIDKIKQKRINDDPYGATFPECMREIEQEKQEALNKLEELYHLSD